MRINSGSIRTALLICLAVSFIYTSALWLQHSPDSPTMLGANGMAFSEDNLLYVASVAAGEVRVIDADTGQLIKTFGRDHGVRAPDDVAFDRHGTLYMTNILQGDITALRKDGTFTIVANLGAGVNSITLRDDDSLWIGRDFLGDGLYRLDANRNFRVTRILESPGWLNASDFGPDGMLYAPAFKRSTIVKIDPESGEESTFFDDLKATPHAVKFNSKGELYILEGQPGRIIRINLTSGAATEVATYPGGLDNLAFDRNDRLYISSFTDGSIHEVLTNGKLRPVVPASDKLIHVLTGVALTLLLTIALLLLTLTAHMRSRKHRHQ